MSVSSLLDLSHTSHTRARTGIQRVARSLHLTLGERATGITFDPYLGRWRTLQAWEEENLGASDPSSSRGARWPLLAKLRGRLRRALGRDTPHLLPAGSHGLVVPELFSPAVAAALPKLFSATTGPRVALFHDAIALRLPELTPTKTVARFPAYLRELLAFDGIAAISADSRAALVDYWHWLEVPAAPPVVSIPLAVDPPSHLLDDNRSRVAAATNPGSAPVILSVGSLEGRKNHLVLLDACERLWAKGRQFELRLIGLTHPQTGAAAAQRVKSLQGAGRPLRYDGVATDDAVARAYAECAFTVYPSLMEGFGLPVLESVSHGKPCICSAGSALGEAARGGGCVTLETVNADALAPAIEQLLTDRSEYRRLHEAARQRRLKSWSDYAKELMTWMATLSPRR